MKRMGNPLFSRLLSTPLASSRLLLSDPRLYRSQLATFMRRRLATSSRPTKLPLKINYAERPLRCGFADFGV